MRLRENESGELDRDPFRVIDAALDAGVSMIDTADMYGKEELVGRETATAHEASVGQVAIAWVHSRGTVATELLKISGPR